MLSRAGLLVALSIAAAGPAMADDVGSCAFLEGPSSTIRTDIIQFKDVFGKNSLFWTQSDYDRLNSLITMCDGVRVGGSPISARTWLASVETARSRALPLAMAHQAVQDRLAQLGRDSIRYPDCRKPAISTAAGENRQREIFGLVYVAMTDADILRSIDFLNQCKPILRQWSSVNRETNWRWIEPKVDTMIDEALTVQAQRAAWEAAPKFETDLLLVRADGAVVIPTSLTSRTRSLLDEYNNWVRSGRHMSENLTRTLLQGSRDILDAPVAETEDDLIYARTIRERVETEMFDK